MTEQLTSPSNYSINENAFRLNNSSSIISPSQSNFGSHLKNNLIHFEEYECQVNENMNTYNYQIKRQQALLNGPIGKKKLTILIDQSYTCPQANQENGKIEKVDKIQKSRPKLIQAFQKQPAYSFQSQQSKPSNCISLISPIESKNTVKFNELQQEMKILQNKYENCQQTIKRLEGDFGLKDEKSRKLEQKLMYIQSQYHSKAAEVDHKTHRIEHLQQKLRQKQQEIEKMKQLSLQKQLKASQSQQMEEKLKEKDSKLRQLVKINQKLKNLNKDLIRQVKASEKKVRDLEKQIQNNVCLATQQNIHRLKQSSLKLKEKQNLQRYNGTYSHSHNHNTKQERDSIHASNNLNTTKQKEKQKQISFGLTTCSNINPAGRKSLQRKKNALGSATSVGQLSQGKKAGRIGPSSSSNILHKKLLHK